jgi:hypothetical protein
VGTQAFPYGLTLLFFISCDSFHIANVTLLLVKDEDDTFAQISVQRLAIVHVSATKHT